MLNFQKSVVIQAPRSQVWAFYERPDILDLLTPPWQPVRVLRREGGLGVGAVTEFELPIGPLPVRWLAVHSDCEPERLFVDVQEEGPFASWVHRHEFGDAPDGATRMTDAIALAMPGGWLTEILLGPWVLQDLERLLTYRHQVTQRECERAARPPAGETSWG